MLFHLDVNSTNKQETLTGCRFATNQRAKRARWGRTATERTTNELRSPKVDLIRLNGLNHILISGEKKMIDIMGVSGATSNITHSPIGQFVMTSPVEFSFAPTNQEKKTVRKSRQDVSIIYNTRQGFKGQGAKLCCLNWTSLSIRPS